VKEPPAKKKGPANKLEVQEAASETDTSPSDAQIKAGNYKKGKADIQGLKISIESPAGSERSGVDHNGQPWTSMLHDHYGYILGTVGKDKDHVDAFIGPNPDSDKVFVIDQLDPATGAFDEHKVMIGYDSMTEAQDAYLANYKTGWSGLGDITQLSMDAFQEWAFEGDTTEPLSGAVAKAEQYGGKGFLEKYGTAASGDYGHAGRAKLVGGSSKGGGQKKNNISDRAKRALASYKPCTRKVQTQAKANEALLAQMIRGEHIGDNKPFDVLKHNNRIECKTIVRGTNDKITMHKESLARKVNEAKKLRITAHTIVFDDRNDRVYYKKGVGSFRLDNMQLLGAKTRVTSKLSRLFKVE